MINEGKNHKRLETGPQGTRVLRREKIDLYINSRKQNSKKSLQANSGAALLGLNGPFANQRFDIPAGRSTVGRSGNNAIVIGDNSVSLVHARLIQKGSEWWVLNLLSTNGTFVNNRKVTDSLLRDGDHIRFGEVELVFHQTEPVSQSFLNRLRMLWSRLGLLLRRRERT